MQGRKGDQAIQLSVLDPTPSVAKAMRKKPEDMVNIVEDLMKLLESLEQTYRRGRHTDPRRPSRPRPCCARSPLSSSSASDLTWTRGRWQFLPARRSLAPAERPRRPRPTKISHATKTAAMVKQPELGDQRDEHADEAADHPRQLKQRLGAGEHTRTDAFGDLALNQRVERELAQRLAGARDQRRGSSPGSGRRTRRHRSRRPRRRPGRPRP